MTNPRGPAALGRPWESPGVMPGGRGRFGRLGGLWAGNSAVATKMHRRGAAGVWIIPIRIPRRKVGYRHRYGSPEDFCQLPSVSLGLTRQQDVTAPCAWQPAGHPMVQWRVVPLMCMGPASAFGMSPQGPSIATRRSLVLIARQRAEGVAAAPI